MIALLMCSYLCNDEKLLLIYILYLYIYYAWLGEDIFMCLLFITP